MNFKKFNALIGWIVFAIATSVYLMTMESTASLWDCGEYITAAYKLEVGHPPGAPLFMVLGRLFSFFAAPESVALWINALSAISSSLTILFMFWSMSLLLKKLVLTQKGTLNTADGIMVLSASSIAALAYTFSDSFWFSAVEGEVYAMASLFTAGIWLGGAQVGRGDESGGRWEFSTKPMDVNHFLHAWFGCWGSLTRYSCSTGDWLPRVL